ncbi:MAG: DPP IV N-terminal domain-containing protein [Bacteroidales bacterium]|nr:DPP IV N-terminal domain-containing protein [Bacteroidales bacterium]
MNTLILLIALAASAPEMNLTPSPDSTMEAFTRGGDLWVRDIPAGTERRLTSDGGPLVYNGYASWVYYEEILGRSSKYKAFWWSPDSRRLGFYRFDDTPVGEFPIWSPFGPYGSLNLTRYPKAGTPNPRVRVGIADADGRTLRWCPFPETEYFGIPFWNADGSALYISTMGRQQGELDLWRAEAQDASLRKVYHEEYPTWVDWIDGILPGKDGFYMVRSFETGWEQIYFLPWDGGNPVRLSDGPNWAVRLLRVDEKKGDLWFLAKRSSPLHPALYRLDRRGRVTELTDPSFWVSDVKFSADGRRFTARLSTAAQPWRTLEADAYGGRAVKWVSGPGSVPDDRPQPQPVCLRSDGFDLYGLISYPRGFDAAQRYPVVMQVYGGPGTPYVRDYWGSRDASDRWCYENGIVYLVADPRSSGENGRRGMDGSFCRMTVPELGDYRAWAAWLKAQPWCSGKIGVKGFSFGGTSTAMLVLRYPETFCCGIAGGGVYDWSLYDSHYTERFMQTPQLNPDGYREASVLSYIADLQPGEVGRLRLTHGTGDDNVHLQNTLLLADALQKAGISFELMLYPDALHGYRGAQKVHSDATDAEFWNTYLR